MQPRVNIDNKFPVEGVEFARAEDGLSHFGIAAFFDGIGDFEVNLSAGDGSGGFGKRANGDVGGGGGDVISFGRNIFEKDLEKSGAAGYVTIGVFLKVVALEDDVLRATALRMNYA